MKKFSVVVYNEDVAFNTIRQINNRFDITHNLENVVYNELIYMGYSLTVFNINGKEIDYSTSTVQHIKLKDFLFMEDLES